MLCVFFILPVAILALYPFKFFQKFLNLFPVRWYILHTFVDSFQGCYKDGTEPGTHDYRWFSAVFLIFRGICFSLYGVTLAGGYLSLSSLFILLVVISVVAFQPYKNRFALHFKTNTIFLVLYAMLFVVAIAIKRADIAVTDQGYLNFLYTLEGILWAVPLISIFAILLYLLFSRCTRCLRLVHILRWQRQGYVAVCGDNYSDGDAHCDRVMNPQS